jgi:putative flippase GtrA
VAIPPVLLRLARSGFAGAFATATDLGTLTMLVSGLGISPRIANVPALVMGSIVMFFGQKHFAFRRGGGRLDREIAAFAVVQIIGLGLGAALFDLGLRIPGAARFYVVVRLVTSNLVWLLYSFPLWHFVFKKSLAPDPSQSARP